MTGKAVRAALATLATAPLLVFGAAQASAYPVIEPGAPGGPIDGRLYDHHGVDPYQCIVVGAPGVGYATNEAGQDGTVNGVFVNEGSINHWCYGPPGMIHNGTGYVR
ncbi:hypothetical protein [Rhodococcus rhodochrous]|uniref:hypothetical protein n=1 Tax=Rhodococcus rhodochrous TaxID=1829 RepID=UPI00215B6F6A|nr:hypothetical protein [Rhodococcus pyridinivorans]